jgi:hypothetical protein
MRLKTEIITPAKAETLLKFNNNNRPVSKAMVDIYAKEILANKWVITGDTIKFGITGNLIDGQHRLKAIIKANKPIETIVAYDVDDSVFKVIDTGKKRTAADCLAIEGYKNWTVMAAALNLLHRYETGLMDNVSCYGNMSGRTNNEIITLLAIEHPGMEVATSEAKALRNLRPLIPTSAVAFTYYILSKIDEEMAREFFNGLNTGEDLKKTSPILHLRNKFQNWRFEAQHKRAAISSFLYVNAIFRTWNYWIEGAQKSRYIIEHEKLETPKGA